jgi:uncharacterized membrane protein
MVPYRRYSWIPVVVAATFSISSAQLLDAQPSGTNQPVAAPAASGELKTLAVVAGARYEKLIGDITFLGPLVGKPQAGQLAEAIVNQYTMGKAATAIDKTKPWGVIVQTDGSTFYPVVCLPISKPDDILDVAKAYGADVKDGENGTKELVLPNRPPLYMKSQNDAVFISSAAASLSRLPANALEILTKMVADYDLSAAVAVKNIPEMYRQFAIGALQAGMQQGMRKQPGETDEQFGERQRLAQAQVEQVTRMIKEIDTVKIGWAIDSQQRRTYFDFTYQFLPDSKMAKQVAAYGQPHTNFAGFYQPDAAITATVSTDADPKLIAEDLTQFENMLRNVRQQLNSRIDKTEHETTQSREAVKAAISDVMDSLEATVKAGHIDAGGAYQFSPEHVTFVAGLRLKEPEKIEEALKKVEAAGPEHVTKVQWNAANHAGVRFHTLTAPVRPDTKEVAERLGLGTELNMTLGIGSDAVYLGFGKDNLDALKKAIDASQAAPNKAVPPFEASIALQPIMEFFGNKVPDGPKKEFSKSLTDVLKDQAPGRDHVRVVGQVIPNGLRYRIEAEDGVLRLIGVAAAHAPQAGIGGGN